MEENVRYLTPNYNIISGFVLYGFLCGTNLKIFVPIALLAFAVLVPVNWTSGTLENEKGLSYDQIDKLPISNIGKGSKRFWAHIVMCYVFTFWMFFVLFHEYKVVTTMRLRFLANQNRRPDQYTVLVRNVPPDPDESVSEHVEHFFAVNHRDHYLSHQIVYNANHLSGLVEKKKGLQNWLIYYENRHAKNPEKKPTMKTGLWGLWGQKVDAIEYYKKEIEELCKQEYEERQKVITDPNSVMPAAFVPFKTRWGAAVCAQTQQTKPRDVYWANLAIPYAELSVRRLIVAVSFFFLTFFFMVPIAIVQSLANLDDIEKVLPFLKPIIERNSLKPVIQGFLPGIVLKIFLILLPTILMAMSKIEAAEVLRLKPLVIFHIKNAFLVRTEHDREQAMDPGSLDFYNSEPRLQLYFLLGLVYAVVTPMLLPFIIVFFSLAYLVFRHQIINVYNQQYESGAQFWPDVHMRLIIALMVSQILLLGLLSTQEAEKSTIALLPLPVLSLWFHYVCKGRFEPAFVKFPLQDAMVKDTLERAHDPTLNLRDYLKGAYVHPVFQKNDICELVTIDEEEKNPLVVTKRQSRMTTPGGSKFNSSSGTNEGEFSRVPPP
ncbi:hypothetical protein C2845_PM06G22650 [Panicum miliaceum]|uniref:CSC1-like protein n=1 Tax=Panicum miliaceum TaxID=4540 RepID=A0A3L6RAQ3_PANMI|nr:hypothetical protein C2845_PM06G22650 [Panicum miliaceum]